MRLPEQPSFLSLASEGNRSSELRRKRMKLIALGVLKGVNMGTYLFELGRGGGVPLEGVCHVHGPDPDDAHVKYAAQHILPVST